MKPNIFPAIRYKNAVSAIDWLVRAFAFETKVVYEGPGNTIGHAELAFGAGLIMLNSAGDPTPGNPWTTVRQGVYVAVTDADIHHARAKAAGAEIVMPLHDTDYGSREYSARDLDAHLWSFGTYNPAGEGSPDITPGLRYPNGPAALDWLERAFGFERSMVVPGPDDTIAHAEMRLGAGYLMLGSTPEDPKTNPWAGERQGTNVALDDVDGHCARAKAAGATILLDIGDTSYGSRAYTALDLEGHLWTFGTYRPQP